MRFYANENFPQPVVAALRDLGHDVVTSFEAGRANQRIEDADVLAYAHSDRRILLTLNRKHFRRLHNGGQPHHGIVGCTKDIDFKRQARRIHEEVGKLVTVSGLLVSVTKQGSLASAQQIARVGTFATAASTIQHFWLTTHWPPLKGEGPHTYNVYLQHRFESLARELQSGDRVFFYELISGRARVKSMPDGTQTLVRRERGRGGIVASGTVSGNYRSFSWPADAVQTYADGTKLHWAWEVPVVDHDYSGFVRRENVIRVLGFRPNYYLRGFGIGGSGLKELEKAQFDELAAMFKSKQHQR